jgi:hypothetical protein
MMAVSDIIRDMVRASRVANGRTDRQTGMVNPDK